MEQKFLKEEPAKAERVKNGFLLNYDVQETPMEEIERQWRLSRGGMDGEDAGSPDTQFVSDHKYMYYSVRVPMGRWNYAGIVEAIIRDKYTTDEMEAITNNMNALVGEFFNVLVTDGIVGAIKHLVDSKDDSNSEAFKEMQLWRAMAKREAKKVLKM